MGITDDPERVVEVFEGTQVRLLENEWVEKSWQDRTLLIGGASFHGGSQAAKHFLGRLEDRPGEELRILCAHYPDVVYELKPSTRVHLIVAGRTHGGQVQVPLFGPPITLSTVPRQVAAGGYHLLDGLPLYVSRGLGCERNHAPRVRFLAPPELSLSTLSSG